MTEIEVADRGPDRVGPIARQAFHRDPDLERSEPAMATFGRRAGAPPRIDGLPVAATSATRRAAERPRRGDDTRTGRVGDRPGSDRLDRARSYWRSGCWVRRCSAFGCWSATGEWLGCEGPPSRPSPSAEALCHELAGRMRLRLPRRCCVLPSCRSPCLDGLRRPAILLPEDAEQNLRETFVHELAPSGPPRRAVEPAPATGHRGALGPAAALGVVAADRGDGRGGLRRFRRRIRRRPGPIRRPPARAGRAAAARRWRRRESG